MAVETGTGGLTLGDRAPEFSLMATDGRMVTLADVAGPKGLVVAFICNHCPYVRAIADRLAEDAVALQAFGVGMVAVMPNDTVRYPQDGFEAMGLFAAAHDFGFPYVIDTTQDVARAYGAVCTPDPFGFDAEMRLRYRGRLDASGATPVPNARRDLVEAMRVVAETGQGPADQFPSRGCSIKWKAAA